MPFLPKLVVKTSPMKVFHCSIFSPFVDIGSHLGSLESQSLGIRFVAILSVIYVSEFIFFYFL